jgi:type I restriction enzyme S subunit
LFPDSFEDSALGDVPTRWRAAPIGDWADALSGGTPSREDLSLWGGAVPWISPKVMTAIHCDQAEQFVTERAVGNGTRLAPAAATLVMVRGMGLHQKVRVSQARQSVTFNQDVKALVPRGIAPSLLLFALLGAQSTLLTKVESSGHGTGKLPSDALLGYRIAMPDGLLQLELAAPFDAMNDRIATAREATRTLSALREALLPKLISGELRVPAAEVPDA